MTWKSGMNWKELWIPEFFYPILHVLCSTCKQKGLVRGLQWYCCFITQLCLTLRPQGLQHARLPCPSGSLGVCSNSCPFSQWCHPTISPSVVPFSCPQSFPASGSFPMSQLFTSGGQSIGDSPSVLPMNIQVDSEVYGRWWKSYQDILVRCYPIWTGKRLDLTWAARMAQFTLERLLRSLTHTLW